MKIRLWCLEKKIDKIATEEEVRNYFRLAMQGVVELSIYPMTDNETVMIQAWWV